jgi:hypothetical protein
MNQLTNKSFATRAVHAGERLDLSEANPVVGSIQPSVSYTFVQADREKRSSCGFAICP